MSPFSLKLLGSNWSEWTSLADVTDVPDANGVYRIQMVYERLDRPHLHRMAYVGEGNLKGRVRSTWRRLPYVNPEDAGDKALASLAYKRDSRTTYRISWTIDSASPHDLADRQDRRAFESCVMWLYRLQALRSALANHERASSMQVQVGTPKTSDETEDHKRRSRHIAPSKTKSSTRPLRLRGFPADPHWMGVRWTRLYFRGETHSPACNEDPEITKNRPGLYKILDNDTRELLQVGRSGDVIGRIRDLMQKFPGSRSQDGPVVAWWMPPPGMFRYCYQEWVDDLIGAYYYQFGTAPRHYENTCEPAAQT